MFRTALDWIAFWTAVAAVAAVLAAVGTVGTLIAALIQIRSERRRRVQGEASAQSERYREQARLIAAWVGRADKEADRTPLYLSNGSGEPVYSVVATIVMVQGAAPTTGEEWLRFAKQREPEFFQTPTTTATILPPGRWRVWIARAGWEAHLSGRASAEVAFTDRAGTHWVRRATGALEELAQPPFEHFGLRGPYDFVTPEAYESA
jgi:hypothetical protein